MPSPVSSLHLVGDSRGNHARAAMAAWQQTRPGGAIRRSADLATATAAPIEELEVIVLLEPTADGVTNALGALGRRALPRWAVVPPSPEDALSVEFARDEWEVPMLVHTLRSAVTILALRRDNARLRGDLKTIGRRLGHDLRTPLTSIRAANEALAGAPGLPANGAAPHLQSIATAVTDATDLLERIGAVLMASARPVDLQPVDMEHVVWSARQTLDARIRSTGATIISAEKWPTVTGVPALLQLVWTNLLANSLEHGGNAPRINLGWERGEAQTRFWIRDTGPGVNPAKRAQLFHSFDRLHELNAPRQFGLSLVHRLVELQAGTTGYDADPKPGGTFFFTLR
jgi:light-regulated signal transduction histidine kinase (bacteriophytochrome)